MILGVISDTHGLLRPNVPDLLAGVDLIVHAGDVGSLAVLEALRAIAPTFAVRGNVDTEPWCTALPETEVVKAGENELFVLHDIAQLKFLATRSLTASPSRFAAPTSPARAEFDPKRAGYRAVIYGHSHRASIEERNGVLYLNPGAAGPRRFDLSPSLARVEVRGQELDVKLLTL
jgi:putative phosphoesterase